MAEFLVEELGPVPAAGLPPTNGNVVRPLATSPR